LDPDAVLSVTIWENRKKVSPRVFPPMLVAIQSFTAGWCTSPKYSHMKLPAQVYGIDSQYVIPFDRAALKYRLPWYGCAYMFVAKLLSSYSNPFWMFSSNELIPIRNPGFVPFSRM
jgi:hypothetical protein